MGFRAKVNNVKGYFTAAHCTNGLNTSISSGTVKAYKNSGNAEYAFIATNSSYTTSNELYYTTSSSPTALSTTQSSSVLSVGTAIAKVGFATKYTSGTVTYNNLTLYESSGTLTHLVATNANANHGDSGGAVFIPSGSSTASIAGILYGGISSTSDKTMIFSRQDYIFTYTPFVLY